MKVLAAFLMTLGSCCLAAWLSIGCTIAAMAFLGDVPTNLDKLMWVAVGLFIGGCSCIYWGRAIIDSANFDRARKAISNGRGGRIRVG